MCAASIFIKKSFYLFYPPESDEQAAGSNVFYASLTGSSSFGEQQSSISKVNFGCINTRLNRPSVASGESRPFLKTIKYSKAVLASPVITPQEKWGENMFSL